MLDPEHARTCDTCGTTNTQGWSESIQEVNGEYKVMKTECPPCRDRASIALYKNTGDITTNLMTLATLASDSRITVKHTPEEMFQLGRVWASMGRIHDKVKEFEREVWFGGHDPSADDTLTEPHATLGRPYCQYKDGTKAPKGSLQEFIVGETQSGHSTFFVDDNGKRISLLSYALCGRWRMTIQDNDGSGAFIDLITQEEGPDNAMGVNGICATEREAIHLLIATIKAWKDGSIHFIDNSGIRILGT